MTNLKGSEKQINWANVIREDAVNTVAANIERLEKSIKEFNYGIEELEAWNNIKAQIENAFNQLENASDIIDRRNALNPSQLCKMATNMANKIKMN